MLIGIDRGVVDTNLIERAFEMLLDVRETDQDQSEEHRHDVEQFAPKFRPRVGS